MYTIKTIINDKFNLIILLAMTYVTCKLTCNPLFFRQLNLTFGFLNKNLDLQVLSSSLIFPIIYIVSDLISLISNRKTAIFIVIVGIICDGIFSYLVNFVTYLPIPKVMTNAQLMNTQAINTIGSQIWRLFTHGVLATIIANIAEILIFISLFKKIKSFFLSTVISVFIILLFHNIITDYPLLKNQIGRWEMIFNSIWINMSVMIIYAALFSSIICLKNRYSRQ